MRQKRGSFSLSENEVILCGLERTLKLGGENASKAAGLLQWYLRNKSWTPKQKAFAASLVAESSIKPKKKPRKTSNKKYHLYAIIAGNDVKLGFSSNVQARINELQVGQATELSLAWNLYVGRSQGMAMVMERKLHKLCKKHKIRGEWFSSACMEIVRAFKVPERTKKNKCMRDT